MVWGDAVWHACQTAPGDGVWADWQSLGHPPEPVVSRLTVVPNNDGRLEVFALDFFGAVWHAWQTTPGDDWTGWHSLGTPSDEVSLTQVDPPEVARNEDGRLELFMRGNDERLWHCWQREAGSRSWAAWSPLASPGDQVGLSGPPMVARNNDGRLEVFAQAGDGAIWHRWQLAAGADSWAAWSSLGTIEGSDKLCVGGAHADGRLVLFAAGMLTTPLLRAFLQERHQTAPNNGWSAWTPIPNMPGEVADMRVTLDGQGRLQLLMRSLNPAFSLVHVSQRSPNSTEWQTGLVPTLPVSAPPE